MELFKSQPRDINKLRHFASNLGSQYPDPVNGVHNLTDAEWAVVEQVVLQNW